MLATGESPRPLSSLSLAWGQLELIISVFRLFSLVAGGTLAHALNMIVERGARPENIRVICALAAPPGLSKISESFPGESPQLSGALVFPFAH